jgi:tRNA G26 N,N-dimethylase Trm1
LHREVGIRCVCDCGNKLLLIGPLFVGQIFDEKLTKKMKSFGEYEKFFGKVLDEIKADVPWFYATDVICRKYHLSYEPRLKDLGYPCSYINPKGIKTKLDIKELVDIFKKKQAK